jgi:DNA mismatch repair protein MutS2
VTIIHGLGTGALRDAVRSAAGSHPLVSSIRAGERGEGGDGATIVTLG